MGESGKSITEIVKVWGGGAERALDLVREVRGEALLDAALVEGRQAYLLRRISSEAAIGKLLFELIFTPPCIT